MKQSVRVSYDGIHVLLFVNGLTAAQMPWQAADALAKAITAKARQAEANEQAVVQRIIGDQALLMRAGAPIALSGDRDVLREAAKEAIWGSRLRRALPHREIVVPTVGTPTVTVHPPKKAPPP